LVHPKFRHDALALSKAVDMLLLDVWPNIDLRAATKAIQDAALFQYIPEKQRPAAQEYKRLAGEKRLDWKCFDQAGYNTADGTVSTEEHAERAMLLTLVSAKGGTSEVIKGQFGHPNSLSVRLRELETALTVEGREGISDVKMAAIERIANDLVPARPEGKKGRRKRDEQLPL
jgi:hypothetical protein